MRKLMGCLTVAVVLVVFVSVAHAPYYIDVTRTSAGSFNNRYAIEFRWDYEEEVGGELRPYLYNLPNVDEFTFEIWTEIYSLPFSADGQILAGAMVASGFEPNYDYSGFGIFGNSSDSSLIFQMGDGDQTLNTLYSQDLSVNTLYYVVFTYNNTSNELKAYINGEKIANMTAPTYKRGGALTISGYSDELLMWNGTVDEFKLWDRTLSDFEVSYTYNNGQGRYLPYNQTGLDLWFHLNEGAGYTTYGELGNWASLTVDSFSYETCFWVEGFVPSYADSIIITGVQSGHAVSLYDSINNLVNSTTGNSQGVAIMHIPDSYLESSFAGTFYLYDGESNLQYSEEFQDISGGDEYQAVLPSSQRMTNVVSRFLPVAGFGLSVAFIVCFFSIVAYSKDIIESFIVAAIITIVSLGAILVMLAALTRMGV